jgi:hypothetical protein
MKTPRQKAKDKLALKLMVNQELTSGQCKDLAAAIVDGVMDATMQELRAKWQRQGARALGGGR